MKKIKPVYLNLSFLCCVCSILFLIGCCGKTGGFANISLPVDTMPAVRATSSSFSYLALGDSYTIGQSVLNNDRFPVQAVAILRNAGILCKEAELIGKTGWTTGNLLSALTNKAALPAYDVVTLLIGVNNQFQGGTIEEYRAEFTSLLKKSIKYAGNRPNRVIVLSIPDYSITPFAKYSDRDIIAREIDSFNIVNSAVAASYRVNYINITDESRKAARDLSLLAPDSLHFSGKEYHVWASMLIPVIKQAIQ